MGEGRRSTAESSGSGESMPDCESVGLQAGYLARAPPPGALDDGCEGAGDEQWAVEIGFEFAAYVVDRGPEEGYAHRGTGVVDQDRDVLGQVGGGGNGRGVGDLEGDRDGVGMRDGSWVPGDG